MKFLLLAILTLCVFSFANIPIDAFDEAHTIKTIAPEEEFEPMDALAFTRGLLEGLGEEYDYSQCIQDVETIVTDVISAYHDAKRENVRDFFASLGNAFEKISDALSACKRVEELEKVIKEFKHPWQLVFHAGKALLINGKDVLTDFEGTIQAWDNGDYRAAGRYVGEIAGMLTNAPAPELIETVTPKDASLFTLGLLEGLGEEYHYEKCIKYVEGISTDLINGFQEAEGHEWAAFFGSLGDVFEKVSKAMAPCKDMKELEKVIDEFKHPKDLVYHMGKELLFHGKDVLHEVEGCVSAYKDGDLRSSGRYVGEIVGTLTDAPAPEEEVVDISRDEVVELIEGILLGVAETEAHDFEACLHDIERIWSDLEAAYSSVTSHDVSTFFAKLGDALDTISKAISDCGDTVKELEDAAELFTGGWVHILWDAGKSLLVNGKEIYHFFEAARSSWYSGNYKKCGINIGDIIGTVLE